MASGTVSVEKNAGNTLTIGDRIDIIKGKRAFPLVFPLSMLLLMIVLFGIITGGNFFQLNIMKGIFNQSIITGTIATAVCFIFATGNIDFSVGSVMGLSAVLGAMVYQTTENMVLMIIVTLISGIILMLFNGILGSFFHVSGAMVAIVAMSVYNAIVVVLVGANPISVDYTACKDLESLFRPVAFIAYFAFCLVIFHKTRVGKILRLIGGNEKCAIQTGMNIVKAQRLGFLLAGIGVGLAGVFQIIRTGNVAQGIAGSLGMDVMLATVLGGMSIFGGAKSNAFAGFLGAVTVTTLNKGLLMIGVSTTMIQGVRGVVFLLLVFLNSERQRTLPSRQQF